LASTARIFQCLYDVSQELAVRLRFHLPRGVEFAFNLAGIRACHLGHLALLMVGCRLSVSTRMCESHGGSLVVVNIIEPHRYCCRICYCQHLVLCGHATAQCYNAHAGGERYVHAYVHLALTSLRKNCPILILPSLALMQHLYIIIFNLLSQSPIHDFQPLANFAWVRVPMTVS
jgi:hypothetical protein